MRLKAYLKYKPSGVDWLGDVPVDWNVKRLKYSFNLNTRKADSRNNPIALENIESWTGKYLETESEFDGEGIYFQKGDVLFGKLRPYLAKVYLAETAGEAIGDLFVLHPRNSVIGKYAAYLIRTRNYIEVIDGSTYGAKMPRASWDFMGSLSFLIPSLSEQKCIADFLDRETCRVDDLIAKKVRVIELLREKRTALISRAITKGLNPNVRFKSSGVEWLGDVPEHWIVRKLKYYVQAITGFAFSSDDYVDEGIPLIRIGDILEAGMVDVKNAKKLPDEFLSDYRFCQINNRDILMAMTGATIGKVGRYCDVKPGLLNQRVCMFRSSVIDQNYLWYLLKMPQYSEHIKLTGFGGAQPNISDRQMLDFCALLPPIHEQQIIVKYLDRETGGIDDLTAKVTQAIEKLKEYRTGIISAAVTGKIDVREGA